MMNAVDIQAIADIATVAISAVMSAFISGMSRGSLKTDIDYIKRDLETIKSMFTLTVKLPEHTKDGK